MSQRNNSGLNNIYQYNHTSINRQNSVHDYHHRSPWQQCQIENGMQGVNEEVSLLMPLEQPKGSVNSVLDTRPSNSHVGNHQNVMLSTSTPVSGVGSVPTATEKNTYQLSQNVLDKSGLLNYTQKQMQTLLIRRRMTRSRLCYSIAQPHNRYERLEHEWKNELKHEQAQEDRRISSIGSWQNANAIPDQAEIRKSATEVTGSNTDNYKFVNQSNITDVVLSSYVTLSGMMDTAQSVTTETINSNAIKHTERDAVSNADLISLFSKTKVNYSENEKQTNPRNAHFKHDLHQTEPILDKISSVDAIHSYVSKVSNAESQGDQGKCYTVIDNMKQDEKNTLKEQCNTGNNFVVSEKHILHSLCDDATCSLNEKDKCITGNRNNSSKCVEMRQAPNMTERELVNRTSVQQNESNHMNNITDCNFPVAVSAVSAQIDTKHPDTQKKHVTECKTNHITALNILKEPYTAVRFKVKKTKKCMNESKLSFSDNPLRDRQKKKSACINYEKTPPTNSYYIGGNRTTVTEVSDMKESKQADAKTINDKHSIDAEKDTIRDVINSAKPGQGKVSIPDRSTDEKHHFNKICDSGRELKAGVMKGTCKYNGPVRKLTDENYSSKISKMDESNVNCGSTSFINNGGNKETHLCQRCTTDEQAKYMDYDECVGKIQNSALRKRLLKDALKKNPLQIRVDFCSKAKISSNKAKGQNWRKTSNVYKMNTYSNSEEDCNKYGKATETGVHDKNQAIDSSLELKFEENMKTRPDLKQSNTSKLKTLHIGNSSANNNNSNSTEVTNGTKQKASIMKEDDYQHDQVFLSIVSDTAKTNGNMKETLEAANCKTIVTKTKLSDMYCKSKNIKANAKGIIAPKMKPIDSHAIKNIKTIEKTEQTTNTDANRYKNNNDSQNNCVMQCKNVTNNNPKVTNNRHKGFDDINMKMSDNADKCNIEANNENVQRQPVRSVEKKKKKSAENITIKYAKKHKQVQGNMYRLNDKKRDMLYPENKQENGDTQLTQLTLPISNTLHLIQTEMASTAVTNYVSSEMPKNVHVCDEKNDVSEDNLNPKHKNDTNGNIGTSSAECENVSMIKKMNDTLKLLLQKKKAESKVSSNDLNVTATNVSYVEGKDKDVVQYSVPPMEIKQTETGTNLDNDASCKCKQSACKHCHMKKSSNSSARKANSLLSKNKGETLCTDKLSKYDNPPNMLAMNNLMKKPTLGYVGIINKCAKPNKVKSVASYDEKDQNSSSKSVTKAPKMVVLNSDVAKGNPSLTAPAVLLSKPKQMTQRNDAYQFAKSCNNSYEPHTRKLSQAEINRRNILEYVRSSVKASREKYMASIAAVGTSTGSPTVENSKSPVYMSDNRITSISSHEGKTYASKMHSTVQKECSVYANSGIFGKQLGFAERDDALPNVQPIRPRITVHTDGPVFRCPGLQPMHSGQQITRPGPLLALPTPQTISHHYSQPCPQLPHAGQVLAYPSSHFEHIGHDNVYSRPEFMPVYPALQFTPQVPHSDDTSSCSYSEVPQPTHVGPVFPFGTFVPNAVPRIPPPGFQPSLCFANQRPFQEHSVTLPELLANTCMGRNDTPLLNNTSWPLTAYQNFHSTAVNTVTEEHSEVMNTTVLNTPAVVTSQSIMEECPSEGNSQTQMKKADCSMKRPLRTGNDDYHRISHGNDAESSLQTPAGDITCTSQHVDVCPVIASTVEDVHAPGTPSMPSPFVLNKDIDHLIDEYICSNSTATEIKELEHFDLSRFSDVESVQNTPAHVTQFDLFGQLPLAHKHNSSRGMLSPHIHSPPLTDEHGHDTQSANVEQIKSNPIMRSANEHRQTRHINRYSRMKCTPRSRIGKRLPTQAFIREKILYKSAAAFLGSRASEISKQKRRSARRQHSKLKALVTKDNTSNINNEKHLAQTKIPVCSKDNSTDNSNELSDNFDTCDGIRISEVGCNMNNSTRIRRAKKSATTKISIENNHHTQLKANSSANDLMTETLADSRELVSDRSVSDTVGDINHSSNVSDYFETNGPCKNAYSKTNSISEDNAVSNEMNDIVKHTDGCINTSPVNTNRENNMERNDTINCTKVMQYLESSKAQNGAGDDSLENENSKVFKSKNVTEEVYEDDKILTASDALESNELTNFVSDSGTVDHGQNIDKNAANMHHGSKEENSVLEVVCEIPDHNKDITANCKLTELKVALTDVMQSIDLNGKHIFKNSTVESGCNVTFNLLSSNRLNDITNDVDISPATGLLTSVNSHVDNMSTAMTLQPSATLRDSVNKSGSHTVAVEPVTTPTYRTVHSKRKHIANELSKVHVGRKVPPLKIRKIDLLTTTSSEAKIGNKVCTSKQSLPKPRNTFNECTQSSKEVHKNSVHNKAETLKDTDQDVDTHGKDRHTDVKRSNSTLEHSVTGSEEQWCQPCGKRFTARELLLRHFLSTRHRTVIGLPTVHYECKICRKSYCTKRSLIRHYKSKMHHRAQEIENLVKDTVDSTSASIYECIICKQTFSSEPLLQQHFQSKLHKNTLDLLQIESSVPTGDHKCTICKRTFVSNVQLIKHVQSKMHMKRLEASQKTCIHECNVCNRQFKFKCHLVHHCKSMDHQKRREVATTLSAETTMAVHALEDSMEAWNDVIEPPHLGNPSDAIATVATPPHVVMEMVDGEYECPLTGGVPGQPIIAGVGECWTRTRNDSPTEMHICANDKGQNMSCQQIANPDDDQERFPPISGDEVMMESDLSMNNTSLFSPDSVQNCELHYGESVNPSPPGLQDVPIHYTAMNEDITTSDKLSCVKQDPENIPSGLYVLADVCTNVAMWPKDQNLAASFNYTISNPQQILNSANYNLDALTNVRPALKTNLDLLTNDQPDCLTNQNCERSTNEKSEFLTNQNDSNLFYLSDLSVLQTADMYLDPGFEQLDYTEMQPVVSQDGGNKMADETEDPLTSETTTLCRIANSFSLASFSNVRNGD